LTRPMFRAAGEAATKPTNGAGACRFLGISRPGATTTRICTRLPARGRLMAVTVRPAEKSPA
jgi:hypothetical protein